MGDYHQLPPINNDVVYLARPLKKDITAQKGENAFWSIEDVVILTESMRQKDDLEFSNFLDEIAEGKVTAKHYETLLNHDCFYDERKSDHCAFYERATHLYATNAQADKWNEKCMKAL